MASSTAKTETAYLAALPGDRRKVISDARALVRRHIPKGYKEAMGYGMGKSCLRFVTIDDIVPDAVGQIIAATTPAQMVAIYHASRSGRS